MQELLKATTSNFTGNIGLPDTTRFGQKPTGFVSEHLDTRLGNWKIKSKTNRTKIPLNGEFDPAVGKLPIDAHTCRKNTRFQQMTEHWKVTQTRHELLVDWDEIKDSSPQSFDAGFERVMMLFESTGKHEFIVENIVPGYQIGHADPQVVLQAEERIVSIFVQATKARFRDCQVYRLSLRHGAFDLRFYLGRSRPTDYWGPDDGFMYP
jgi:hypothetical protein